MAHQYELIEGGLNVDFYRNHALDKTWLARQAIFKFCKNPNGLQMVTSTSYRRYTVTRDTDCLKTWRIDLQIRIFDGRLSSWATYRHEVIQDTKFKNVFEYMLSIAPLAEWSLK